MGDLPRRVKALERHQAPDPEALTWMPWPGQEDAWAHVSDAEKAELRRQFVLAGGCPGGTVIVRREDTGWRLETFNVPLGRACYLLQRAMEEGGEARVAAWLSEQADAAEHAALARALAGGWRPAGLAPGNALVLERMAERLTRALSGAMTDREREAGAAHEDLATAGEAQAAGERVARPSAQPWLFR